MFKKTVALFTTSLLALALAVGAATPAMAYSAAQPPTGVDANHEENWEWAPGEVCIKDDNSRTTPSYTVVAPPAGTVYSKIILKAGGVSNDPNTVFTDPQVGAVLITKSIKNISHIIFCTIPTPPTAVTVEAAPSFTPATCDAGGTLVVPAQAGIVWTGGADGDGPGTYTLHAAAATGYVLSGQQVFTVSVPPMKSAEECTTSVTPLEPDVTWITECGTYGSVVADDTDEFDYTIVGSGGQGTYTVTAVARPGYVLAEDANGNPVTSSWTYELGTYVDCLQACTVPSVGPVSTNLAQAGWDLSTETRANGSWQYVDGGLRVVTTSADYFGKSAGYIATDFPLASAGEPALELTYSNPGPTQGAAPGVNLTIFVDKGLGAGPQWFGNLVKEPLFDYWWINKAVPGMPVGTNPGYQLAAGSLSEFAFAFAQLGWTTTVKAVGYSLGSGAIGDVVITKLTAGCIQYTFDAETVAPTVDYRLDVCTANGVEPDRYSTKDLYITLDNVDSSVDVTFTVVGAKDVDGVDPNADIVRTVAAGAWVEVKTEAILDTGGSYVVTFSAAGATIPNGQITVPSFDGCLDGNPGDPSHTNQSCVYGVVTEGSITVMPITGFEYTIDGPNGYHEENVGEVTTGLAPGDYVVTVTALPGYVLVGPTQWPYEVKIEAPDHCEVLPIPVILTSQIECSAQGSYTLPSLTGVEWYVGGVNVNADTYYIASAASIDVTAKAMNSTYGFPGGATEVVIPLLFAAPEICADAAANVTATPATCLAAGGVNPATLTLTNATWDAPLPTTPGSYTVTATALQYHSFPGGTTTKSISLVIPAKLDAADPACDLPTFDFVVPTISFVQPTCTAAGSYTLGGTNVLWRLAGDPTLITAGTYSVSSTQTLNFVASAVAPHGIDPADVNHTLTFTKPSAIDCLELTTLAFTGGMASTGLLTVAGGLVFLGIAGMFLARRRLLSAR